MLFNTKILPFKKYIFQNDEKTKQEKHSAAWLVHFTNTLTAFFLACGFFWFPWIASLQKTITNLSQKICFKFTFSNYCTRISLIVGIMTHLVKLHTESEPFYAMTEWNKDQTSVEVKLLQKDKAWKFVLNGNDMGAVAKKLQVFRSPHEPRWKILLWY